MEQDEDFELYERVPNLSREVFEIGYWFFMQEDVI